MDDAAPEPILTVAEMAAVDAAAIAAGVPIDTLMENAGRAVANVAARRARPGERVAVLCGPGNNGGDGFVAARVLAGRGYRVEAFAARVPANGAAGRARTAAGERLGAPAPIETFEPAGFALVIDALYGAGLSRPLEGVEAAAASRLNGAAAPVVAVDVPSGLPGDTGGPVGAVVEADLTVTFFRLKPAHLLWPGRGLCGKVIVEDIGLTVEHLATAAAPRLWRNTPALWRPARNSLAADAHKYIRGACLVVSGGEFATGAARLAATAALNAGAGAATLCGEASALRVHAAHVTAIMLAEAPTRDAFAALLDSGRYRAVVLGPAAGVTDETGARLEAVLSRPIACVLDADAITVLAQDPAAFFARPALAPRVLTPHAGEFRRLFGDWTGSKVEATRTAARLSDTVVIHKGVDTVIAAPDGRAAINDNAGPELATAGSGDVLAGIVAAHLGLGMPAFEAASAAVHLHAATGAAFGNGLTADRLVATLRPLPEA